MKKHEIVELFEHFDDDGKLLAGKVIKFDCKAYTMEGTPNLDTVIQLMAHKAEISIESVPVAPRVVWLSPESCRVPNIKWSAIEERSLSHTVRFIEDVPLPVSEKHISAAHQVWKDKHDLAPWEIVRLMLENHESQRTAGIK
jgi:hypothetical protein